MSDARPSSPAWPSWLGVVAIVLGVLLAAEHGTEWMKQRVLVNATSVLMNEAPTEDGQLPSAICPEDELIEEGLSMGECTALVDNVRRFLVSAPDWFYGFQTGLAAFGTALALVSILVGAALLDRRRWAPVGAAATFAALAAVDAAGFVAALGTGPILRDIYLWDWLVWFAIHLMMTVGAVAGYADSREAAAGTA